MFVAAPGHDLIVSDYASIEARVLMWFCGQDDAVRMFRDGVDIYVEMAKRIGSGASRQLGKQAVLGCGYGMGSDKFYATCQGYKVDIDPALAEKAVGAYRNTFKKVPQMWYAQERAVKAAITTRKAITCGRVTWAMCARGRDFLYCTLPSGRRLAYHKPKVGADGRITYHTADSVTKKYMAKDLYGGKIVENLIQAIARDIMAWAMLTAEEEGYHIVLTVHDELVAEVRSCDDVRCVEDFNRKITSLPVWAAGCPISAEGWRGKRYKK
jgi:DNA polymerase